MRRTPQASKQARAICFPTLPLVPPMARPTMMAIMPNQTHKTCLVLQPQPLLSTEAQWSPQHGALHCVASSVPTSIGCTKRANVEPSNPGEPSAGQHCGTALQCSVYFRSATVTGTALMHAGSVSSESRAACKPAESTGAASSRTQCPLGLQPQTYLYTNNKACHQQGCAM